MHESVAVLGLGAMGGRVAARLVEVGVEVTGFDPATASRDASRECGVRVHQTPESAVRQADLVVLSLPGPVEVTAASRGPLREVRAGAVVVDMSTIDPETARTACGELSRNAVDYVDAPVLGRPDRCGRWVVPAGGSEDVVGRIQPLLEGTVAARVSRVGDVGAGAAVKVVNNLMFGAINAVTAEALTLGRLSGVEPDTLVDIIAGSGAATVSPLFRELSTKVLAGDYTPTFSLGLLHKDNRLALELAESMGSPAAVARCVDHLNTFAVNYGWADKDTAVIYELYRQMSAEESR